MEHLGMEFSMDFPRPFWSEKPIPAGVGAESPAGRPCAATSGPRSVWKRELRKAERKPWENFRKLWEKPRKLWEQPRKPWENPRNM